MIDFRSDVLGPYEAAVLEAMQSAADDVPGFLRHEDQHQERLERWAAEAFGFEDALFVPTGTMANQIAVRLWCAPGQALVADRESHVAVNEAPSTAGMNGVALRNLDGERGHLSPAQIRSTLEPGTAAGDRGIGLVWLENTHNRAGGTLMPNGWINAIGEVCAERNIPVHLDGARIWHAAAAAGVPLDRITNGASSLTLSLNKAIGAPAGALLLGGAAFIDQADAVRRMFGGMWRPVGILAAAAIAATKGYRERILKTHELAGQLSRDLSSRLEGLGTVAAPETNIVMLELGNDEAARRIHAALEGRGILTSLYGRGRLRLVMHAGFATDALRRASETIASIVETESLAQETTS